MASPHTALRSSLEALSEIAQTINSIRQPNALLEQVLAIAMETLDAERGFILLTAPAHKDGFEVKSSRNFTEAQLGDVVRFSTSVVRTVLQQGEPVLIYEALADARYGEAESVILEQIQSIACVPMRLKNRQIGAIYLDSLTRRGRFTEEHLPFLEAFANQAALALEHARLHESLREENQRLHTEIRRIHGFDEIIGQSKAMQEVFEMMTRVLDSDAAVLIRGESGTGKELVARALHYNGPRKKKPFMAIFCGSLPDDLLESELFGHKKGAFTGAVADKKGLFEAADGGTVFLDEVGDLSHALQTALLRVLQEGEVKRIGETSVRRVDVRVISATNKSLDELIDQGRFRADLFYRLCTIALDLPPLRRRCDDVPLLAQHFLAKYTGPARPIRGFAPEALEAMQRYAWPGNVRELGNAVERAVVLADGPLIQVEDLRLPSPKNGAVLPPGATLKERLRHVERRLVEEALAAHDGNVSQTAQTLGVSRRWLHYRLREWHSPPA